jgi:Flp pilus assembly protein TadD
MSPIERPSPGRVRTIRLVFALLTLALGAGGVAWGVWEASRIRPSLDDAVILADAGKPDEAAAHLRAVVARHPEDGPARLLLAQFLLKGPESASSPTRTGGATVALAEEALGHLDHVRPDRPATAAAFHLLRGNALHRLSRLDEAEADWLEALRIDPTTPEAGWNLLHLYYLELRKEDARRLAMRLFEVEPDPHDRALLLLEVSRHDARPPAPESLVPILEPVVGDHPDDLRATLTLGIALTRASQVEKGIALLRRVAESHPDDAEAWDSLLTCLDESGQVAALEEAIATLPAGIAASPRMLKHRARLAQSSRWEEAAGLYRRAYSAEPHNRVLEYRLSRALRQVGQGDEARRIEERMRRRDLAIEEVRPLFERASAIRDLSVRAQKPIFQKFAELREQMGLLDEARAWHRLVVLEQPGDEVSRAALARLGADGECPETTPEAAPGQTRNRSS